jgi:hypothetical protein
MKFTMRVAIPALLILPLFIPMASAQQSKTKKLEPCSLATKAEIQEALGMSVSDGKLNATNPTLCDHKVGELGALSFFVRQNDPKDAPDKIVAELKKQNIQTTDLKGVGDRSFFSAPGYGMIQLQTFKGSTYIIITLLVPGTAEAKGKAMAEKLMQKIVSKL